MKTPWSVVDAATKNRREFFDFFTTWWEFAKLDPSLLVCMEQAFWDKVQTFVQQPKIKPGSQPLNADEF